MIVNLDDPKWIAVMGGEATGNCGAFEDALIHSPCIGLMFSSTSARGHGVFATAPARFELLSFELE